MSRAALRTLVLTATLLAPVAAFAHPGHGAGVAHDFAKGLAHPLTGLDHMLAMVAVGLLAAHVGGRALWLVPAAFLSMMALGGALGMAGIAVPAVETGIALSLVVLGLAATFHKSVGSTVAVGLAAIFAVFHGLAHGAELPDAASGWTYAGGFLLATAVLHAAGVSAGLSAERLGELARPALRAAATSIALVGVGLLAGWV